MNCTRIWAFEVLTPVRSGQFRRDVKRVEKRGKDLGKLRQLLGLLLAEAELPAAYRDHPLKGIGRAFATPISKRTGC
jgi:mRNA interferase YafQ